MRLVKQVQPSDEDKGLLNGYDYDNDDDLRRRGIVLSVLCKETKCSYRTADLRFIFKQA